MRRHDNGMRLSAAVGSVLALSLIGGCSQTPKEATPSRTTAATAAAPAKPFAIALKSTVNGNRLNVGGTTNLPDGARLTILVGREATFANDGGDPRLIHLGGAGTEVKGGTLSQNVDMDESILVDTVSSGDFGPLTFLSDTVTVCAQLRATDGGKAVQPANVRAVVGGTGELLASSPQKTKFGGETWLEAIQGVKAPSGALDELKAATGKAVKHGPSTGELWCSS